MTKRIAWMLPEMIEGSGGLRTILTKANALVQQGMICDYYFYRHPDHMLPELRAKTERFFQVGQGDFYCGSHLRREYDLAIATAWDSMKVVRDLNVPRKACFIQDYEAWFNPVGDGHLLYETSFFFGLKNITLGRWLNQYIENKFGDRPYLCEFGVDRSSYYYQTEAVRENAICFIYQPEKPRRCVTTAIEALGIVKAQSPNTKIYFYGSTHDVSLWFDVTNLKLLTPTELCNLYNRVEVGLCMSASNPSRIPFEMMACGLPVVDLYRSNNLYDYPSGTILLSHQAPESIADGILKVLRDKNLSALMSENSLKHINSKDIAYEESSFVSAVNNILIDRSPSHDEINLRYDEEPSIAEVYSKTNRINEFCEKQKNKILS